MLKLLSLLLIVIIVFAGCKSSEEAHKAFKKANEAYLNGDKKKLLNT
jgi:PBP1b-binding outer membrane lipoprotein LpoB